MGTLTYTELQNEVRFGLGGRTDLDSRLPSIINLAQQRLARIHDYDEMEVISTTTVNNTGSTNDKYLTLPNKREVFSIVLLDGASSRKLIQRTPQFWDRRIPMPEYWARDRVQDYIIWGQTVELWPLPNATYTLRMRWSQWPQDLVASTDTSQFLQKDEILVELALVYCFNSLGKEDDARKHSANVSMLMLEAQQKDDTHPDLNILPSASDAQVIQDGGLGSTPWLDPFIRSNT
jgi:hypothetical protein